VEQAGNHGLALLLVRYALAYNRREFQWLGEIFAGSVTYASQIVARCWEGREEVASLIEPRLRGAGLVSNLTRVELATTRRRLPLLRPSPAGGGTRSGRPWLPALLDPGHRRRGGEGHGILQRLRPGGIKIHRQRPLPGVPSAQLRAEKASFPPLLPRQTPLHFHLLLRRGPAER